MVRVRIRQSCTSIPFMTFMDRILRLHKGVEGIHFGVSGLGDVLTFHRSSSQTKCAAAGMKMST